MKFKQYSLKQNMGPSGILKLHVTKIKWSSHFIKKSCVPLTSVAQLIGRRPAEQKVTSSVSAGAVPGLCVWSLIRVRGSQELSMVL